jgi:hypothetical protein
MKPLPILLTDRNPIGAEGFSTEKEALFKQNKLLPSKGRKVQVRAPTKTANKTGLQTHSRDRNKYKPGVHKKSPQDTPSHRVVVNFQRSILSLEDIRLVDETPS